MIILCRKDYGRTLFQNGPPVIGSTSYRNENDPGMSSSSKLEYQVFNLWLESRRMGACHLDYTF